MPMALTAAEARLVPGAEPAVQLLCSAPSFSWPCWQKPWWRLPLPAERLHVGRELHSTLTPAPGSQAPRGTLRPAATHHMAGARVRVRARARLATLSCPPLLVRTPYSLPRRSPYPPVLPPLTPPPRAELGHPILAMTGCARRRPAAAESVVAQVGLLVMADLRCPRVDPLKPPIGG